MKDWGRFLLFCSENYPSLLETITTNIKPDYIKLDNLCFLLNDGFWEKDQLDQGTRDSVLAAVDEFLSKEQNFYGFRY